MDIARLIAAGIAPTQARIFAGPLAAACDRFEIDTPSRRAAFVGQCMVESAGFTRLEESLYYTTPERIRAVFPSRVLDMQQAALLARNPAALANCVYAGKNGNGPEMSGDGWRYRGRGLIQLTGRSNYSDAGRQLARPILEFPELVAQPEGACLTAAWYWDRTGGNALADAWAIDAITKAVNGPAMREAALRRQCAEEARQAFA